MTKKTKVIGIVGWTNNDTQFYGVTKPYLEYFRQYGEVYILTPSLTHKVFNLDLLVLPGGRDVNPVRYNQIPGFWTGPSDPFLEYFDEVMLPKYIDKNIPIFGICRGMQSLAVHFGLPLMQHIDGYHEKSVKNRGELVHDLYTFNDRTAKGTFKKDDIICKTNSLHHQGVNVTDMIESDSGLKPLAITDNWVVESFVHSEKKIAGVQYHPEEIYDEHSQKIITSLLND